MAKSEAVLIIGAGVGGIKASLELAEVGHKVYLCERAPSTGGALIQMDKWFPDNHCSLCQMLPTLNRDKSAQFCLRHGPVHPNIELLLNTEVTGLAGRVGDFRVTLETKSTGEYAQLCSGGGPAKATQLGQKEGTRRLQVGAIILSTGFEEFNPHLATQYGYQRYPNVITSLELERVLSAGGSSAGELARPSDSRIPESIAFLQCIGSRDCQRDYCSSVCCMFAIKQVTLIKQEWPQTDVHIFFMDIRAFGKGYHRYFERARNELGVHFSRCRVPVVKEDPQTHNLVLSLVAGDGAPVGHHFELVVLSVGQTPSPKFQELCQVLGVDTNRWGFCQTRPFSMVETSREGIYVCGSAASPKDIADTVTEAGAAAGEAAQWLFLPASHPTKKEPVEKQTEDEEARTAILLCGCGGEIGSALDLEQATDFVSQLPGVVHVEQMPYLCLDESLEAVAKQVRQYKINRLVLGACTYMNESMLYKFTANAGIAPALVRVVNLREEVAWVHRDQPDKALVKTKRLLAMALADVGQQDYLPVSLTAVTSSALVIGGGIAGMTAAMSIARHGIEAHLVERSVELGGNLKMIYSTLENGETGALLAEVLEQVNRNKHIHLHMESEVVAVSGYAGNFSARIKEEDESIHTLEVGAIVVASGGDEYHPTEYRYAQTQQVITQRELERQLFAGELDPAGLSSVIMVQCVGSRGKDRPYCSRVCCSQAIKNALKLKAANPRIEVTVIYQDMMSYGFKEEYYTLAREKGVHFLRYEMDSRPEVKQDKEKITVEFTELVLGGKLVVEPDLVVLSTGIIPGDNRTLADVLAVELDEDGFFCEAEEKFRPVDFLKEGIYVCGLARSPCGVEEAITQAQAAGRRAVSLLTSKQLRASGFTSETVQRQCRKCELCISVCPYDARTKDEETNEIVVREALCQGCGACVVACPSGAAKIRGFRDRQVFSLIDAVF